MDDLIIILLCCAAARIIQSAVAHCGKAGGMGSLCFKTTQGRGFSSSIEKPFASYHGGDRRAQAGSPEGRGGGSGSPDEREAVSPQNRRTRGSADSFDVSMQLEGSLERSANDSGPAHNIGLEGIQIETEEEKRVRQGITKFNIKPKEGIQYLGAHGVFDASDPAEVATFLCSRRIFKGRSQLQSGLSKKQVGHYLGTKGKSETEIAFYSSLRGEFVKHSNFRGVEIDEALREWLKAFVLPGEAQVIDRLIHSFSLWWHESNPDVLSEADSAHILAFAIMMLHTDAHSGKVKKGDFMTKEQFKKMLRGIDQGKDPPPALLSRIYDRVTSTPFDNSSKMKEHDVVTFFNASKEGWLWKQGSGRTRKWKRRWFLLNEHCLYYFKRKPDVALKGTEQCRCVIPLENLRVSLCNPNEKGRKGALFQIESSRGPYVQVKSAKRNDKGQLVQGTHRKMVFRSSSTEGAREWIQCIQMEMAPSPLLLMLQMKRMGVIKRDSENIDNSPISSSSSSAVSSVSALTPLAERSPAHLVGQTDGLQHRDGVMNMKGIQSLTNAEKKVALDPDNGNDIVDGDEDEDEDDRIRDDGELVTDSEAEASEDDDREMRDHMGSLSESDSEIDSSGIDSLDGMSGEHATNDHLAGQADKGKRVAVAVDLKKLGGDDEDNGIEPAADKDVVVSGDEGRFFNECDTADVVFEDTQLESAGGAKASRGRDSSEGVFGVRLSPSVDRSASPNSNGTAGSPSSDVDAVLLSSS